jgi:thymidylate synthase (FAD)
MKAEYIDHMGDDLSVVNAARVSFDKESEWEWEECGVKSSFTGESFQRLRDDDTKLISYLAKHDHWTPFAHTAISLRMSAPIPIRTQCFKHKQGLVENEESRRYISSTPKLFVPKQFRKAPTDGAKQGSGGVHHHSRGWLKIYDVRCRQMLRLYEDMIADGVCPEQARFVLPQGVEVQWIWTGNLYAFANFYLKRTDPHAQKEIRDLAQMVGDIIQPLFPVSWKALTNA